MGRSLLDKVWDLHRVAELPSGETQLFVGLHLVHEVTSPQAFAMLRERGLAVRHPELTVATVDHIVPTDDVQRPFADPMAEQMLQHLERNVAEHGIRYYGLGHAEQGIVHVIGPQLGLTQPGMTIACGDSHTSTHGAFGAIAFGIGTSQVRDVLATQTLAMRKPKLRRITVQGDLGPGVYAKDVILSIIATLGVKGGIGYAYEYSGSTIDAMDMEGRMSICNMSIEGGARVGYVNPDQTTFDFLRGRPEAPDRRRLGPGGRLLARHAPRTRTPSTTTRWCLMPPTSSPWSPGAPTPASPRRSPTRFPTRSVRPTSCATGWPRRSATCGCGRARRWPARRSTSPSSARARTAG